MVVCPRNAIRYFATAFAFQYAPQRSGQVGFPSASIHATAKHFPLSNAIVGWGVLLAVWIRAKVLFDP